VFAAFIFMYTFLNYLDLYRVIRKSLRDYWSLRHSSRDGHAKGEHVNRGRDTPSFCPTLQLLDMSFLLCLSWLLRSWIRKFRRDLWSTLYFVFYNLMFRPIVHSAVKFISSLSNTFCIWRDQ